MPDETAARLAQDIAHIIAGAAVPDTALPADEDARKAVIAAYVLLSRRAFSRREMGDRLRKKVESVEAIETALAWLEQRRLLDDQKLAEDAVRAATSRKGWGSRKTQQWLQGRGIERDVARDAVAAIEPEDEAAQAVVLADRQRARGKRADQIFRFLIARGFPSGVARKAAMGEGER